MRWIIGTILLVTLSYVSPSIVNPAPDNAIVLLEIVAFLFLTQFLINSRKGTLSPLHYRSVLLLISFTLVTVKLSSVVFALATICVIVFDKLGELRVNWRAYRRVIFLVVAFTLVHLGRGYLLSGAPIFPSPFAGAWKLPWAVAREIAEFESALIYSWARLPGNLQPSEVLASWDWIPLWLKTIPLEIKITFSIATIFSVIAWLAFRRKAIPSYQAFQWLYLLVITALVFWFFTAPDVRFLGALLPIYLSLSVWYLWEQIAFAKRIEFRADTNVSIMTRFEFVVFTCAALLFVLKVLGSHPVLTGWSTIYQSVTKSQITRSGFLVHTPVASDQCWDVHLPCTPSYKSSLSFESHGPLHLFRLESD